MASHTKPTTTHPGYVVIGGGIAGVTCVEHLSLYSPDLPITLITASPIVKAVTNFRQISKVIENFSVEEKHASKLQSSVRGLSVIHAVVNGINAEQQIITTDDGQAIPYKKLCICTGGQPDIICKDNPYVLGIRDTETVKSFQKKLASANRVAVVGNGGIASELVYEIEGCTVIWAIRDKSISHTFVDAGAAEFFLPHLRNEKEPRTAPLKRMKYTVSESSDIESNKGSATGGALGPDWISGLSMQGGGNGASHPVYVEYECEVQKILTPEEYSQFGQPANILACDTTSQSWPVYLLLTNGKLYGCDLVISATGVSPNTAPFTNSPTPLALASDGGIDVDNHMRTNLDHVYAAGDVCTAAWDPAPQWFQMRLWSQALQMGAYAAKCMMADAAGEVIHQDFCFEMFAHMTEFFGFKVVLLGNFNGQGLEKDYEVLLRVTLGVEYIKVILKDGKMCGAILIGDTDLEETFENLILNRMDLSMYGEDLLNPGVDIEDYFD
ncbi:pyridine nucleotide-disulfide oxidoreductase domain-containing protein 1-like [Anneissia japonica]|uniref:pyridine nucleotide-disulfide oxidoreductase domain-containing protein 1-like n=1 Tax=Anneissia japonica TaxID=1529436 RepID=UPI0014255741|nr:pyridine nucleotide-disulfide oxidoreductase domain-containing protein 1-like [Anneissia japonica]